MKVVFAKDALFTDDEFSCKKDSISRLPNALSAIYTLQDDKTSFRDSVLISIKTKKEVPERYRTKVLIATCNGKYTTPVGGTYDTGYVSTLIKSFARFVVIVDTIAPAVQPLRIYNRAILTTKAGMFFHAWDGLSGIGKFNCWIDDTWVIMYYDMKSRLLSLWFDPERIEYGKWHQCKLVVEDNRGNARTSEFTFYK